MTFYGKYVKRILDILFSLLGLIVLLPIFVIVMILVRINLGSPVIYKPERPGKNGKIFKLYKFRSMSEGKDENGNLLPDSERLTPFGKKLRATSLDELPELINILKGDMSFIGPRPLAKEYLPYYTDEEMHRHDVRPGLTGLAQAKDRNVTSWERRFSYDLQYIKNISFAYDVKIIVWTFETVLLKKNIGEMGVDAPMDFDEYRRQQGFVPRSEYNSEEEKK